METSPGAAAALDAAKTSLLTLALHRAGVRADLVPQALRLLLPDVKAAVADGRVTLTGPAGDTAEEIARRFACENRHFTPAGDPTAPGARAALLAELDADPRKKCEFIQRDGGLAYQRLVRDVIRNRPGRRAATPGEEAATAGGATAGDAAAATGGRAAAGAAARADGNR